ncbi:MAG: aminoacyl-tRNA hydrolase, partial [Myxococcota bacterium]
LQKYLFVGLGNPGVKYSKNRHNVGYMVITEYINSSKLEIREMKFGAGCETSSAIFIMPDTYMNNSGRAVRHYLWKVGMNPSNICVIQDDMDIERGRVLLKFNGGDNGHNGIRSINTLIGSNKYYRLRIGVGRPYEGVDPADYLLSDFSPEEMDIIREAIGRAADGIDIIIKDGFIKAMNKINRTKNPSKKEEEIND